ACKAAYELKIPNQVNALMRKSIKNAFTAPSGPISIEIPIDYQSTIIDETVLLDDFVTQTELVTTYRINDQVIEQITEAERPVIWVGNGALLANASEEVRQLADTTG